MILSMAEPEVGAPKTNRASKKGKKSWRKNVDMSEVNQYLDEKRFEERVGGSFSDRPDEKLFVIETEAKPEPPKRNRKEPRKLRCFANLEGLPGVPDPKPLRNQTRLPEDRENPVVKQIKMKKIKAGKISKTAIERKENRKRHLDLKEMGKKERSTRRRMEFDFDIWGTDSKASLPSDDWVKTEVINHNAKGKSQYVPKAASERNFSTGTSIPAVEVPDEGASYNPSAKDHQDLLWKAALVEIQKEKELARIERQTTAMFPSSGSAPTEKDYIQEMSEGIVELKQGEPEQEVEEDTIEEVKSEEEETEKKMIKPKTRKQKRDKRGRMFEEQKEKRDKDVKKSEMELMRTKSLMKELRSEEILSEQKQRKRRQEKMEKKAGNLQLSNYKYEPQEIELKLTDELTGNLRNLTPEGSLLEDRFKSMQRRNIIEVRVKQKTVRKLKRKKFEKRSHRMGWEENKNKITKRIRQQSLLWKKNKKSNKQMAEN